MVLFDFSEPIKIIMLHMKKELFCRQKLLVTKNQHVYTTAIIRNKLLIRTHHIWCPTCLRGQVAQGNLELTIVKQVLEATKVHEKYRIYGNCQNLFCHSATRQVRKSPLFFFVEPIFITYTSNFQGTKRNEMNVFHFAEFEKVKFVHISLIYAQGFDEQLR